MIEYTLTPTEAADYDSGDDRLVDALSSSLAERFAGAGTEIYHPDGFVINHYASGAELDG